MPRPRSLTPTTIADAAIAVVDRDGLAALSMRAVAGELGVGTMSLYRYVEGREQLEDLVVERVLADADLEVPSRASWSHRVALLAGRVRDAIGQHPSVAPLLLSRRHTSVATLRWGEAVLAALADGGFAGKARAIAFRTILSYLFGAIQVDQLGGLSGAGTAALTALPRAQFPFVVDTASHAGRISPAEEFAGGLRVILRGLR